MHGLIGIVARVWNFFPCEGDMLLRFKIWQWLWLGLICEAFKNETFEPLFLQMKNIPLSCTSIWKNILAVKKLFFVSLQLWSFKTTSTKGQCLRSDWFSWFHTIEVLVWPSKCKKEREKEKKMLNQLGIRLPRKLPLVVCCVPMISPWTWGKSKSHWSMEMEQSHPINFQSY